MKTLQKVLMFVAVLGLLAAAGCEKPYDYTMQRNRIFLMGRLLVGKTCDVRLIWRQAPEDNAPVTVTADLSEIGGDAAQVLTATGNGIWRWMGQVAPDASGERIIIINTANSKNKKNAISKGFPVFNTEKAVAIGASDYLRLAVMADGTVLAWRNNYDDKGISIASVPEGLADAVAVEAAQDENYGDRCLALKADGTVVEWATFDYINIISGEIPEGLSDVVAISRNAGHSLALKADGSVVAWGSNFYGESDVPAGLTDIVAVSAGALSSFALKADGSLVHWGLSDGGQVTQQKTIAVSGGCCGCSYVVNE
ncbi:MAG: hypothetical protein JW832_16480, partial [Deltaproteobacteria bacterium]|nr:hypothetical protein [Deltaproteobacteria bacterium]